MSESKKRITHKSSSDIPDREAIARKIAIAIALSASFLAIGCAENQTQSGEVPQPLAEHAHVTYTFYRNATARLDYAGRTLLLDPMLAEQGTLPSFAGIAPNPTVALPVDPRDVIFDVDAVIVSHMHMDHFDQKAAEILDKEIEILTPYNEAPVNPADPENTTQSFSAQLNAMGFQNVSTIGSEQGASTSFGDITLTQEFGLHGEGVLGALMGGVNGIIFQAENQPTIYWTNDTILDENGEIEAILRKYAPDIVIAHTGGAVVEAITPNPLMMDEEQAVRFIEIAESVNSDVQIVAVHMEALDHCFTTRSSLGEAIDAHPSSTEFDVFMPIEGEEITFHTF